jgi:xanthine/uracil/vitamin C permease (AzgA family)
LAICDDPQVLLAIGGFVLMTVLMIRKTRGALLIGIVVTALIGGALGFGHAPKAVTALPFTGDYDLSAIAFKLDITSVLQLSFMPVLLTLFLMSFLDTLGTLTGLGAAAKPAGREGQFSGGRASHARRCADLHVQRSGGAPRPAVLTSNPPRASRKARVQAWRRW